MMFITNKTNTKLVLIILMFITISSKAQVLENNTKIEDMYVIQSSNKKFKSIILRKYKDLPLMFYYNENTMEKHKNKVPKASWEYYNYGTLVKLHSIKEYFIEMDRDIPYYLKYRNNNIPDDKKKSTEAQKQLIKTANSLASNANLKWIRGNLTEFEEAKTFSTFVKNTLEDLQKYAAGALINEAYFLVGIPTEYDFEKGGFPLIVRAPGANIDDNAKKSDVGSKSREVWSFETMLKMSPSEAELLVERIKQRRTNKIGIIGVFKIRYSDLAAKRYSIISPTIELFEDKTLINKLGELKLN